MKWPLCMLNRLKFLIALFELIGRLQAFIGALFESFFCLAALHCRLFAMHCWRSYLLSECLRYIPFEFLYVFRSWLVRKWAFCKYRNRTLIVCCGSQEARLKHPRSPPLVWLRVGVWRSRCGRAGAESCRQLRGWNICWMLMFTSGTYIVHTAESDGECVCASTPGQKLLLNCRAACYMK